MNRRPTTETFNDDAGNRLTQDVTYFNESRSIAGTYNAGNELTGLEISYPSASSTTVAFEHNKRGGRTLMTMNPSDPNPTVVNYGYNEDNSLTEYGVVAPGRELEVEFTYSGGLRVEKVATGYLLSGGQQQYYSVHKKYLLDGVDVLLELQVISSTEYVTVLHIPGVLSATLMEGGTSVVRYQLHDAQGNVIALVDTDEEVSAVYLQDSWGIPLVDSDCQTVNLASSPVQVESVPNPYRWGGAHGYYADEDVGMYLMGYRWYDSFTGRFISRDPIGFASGDMNLYRPMGNNPVNAVDPWGLREELRGTADTAISALYFHDPSVEAFMNDQIGPGFEIWPMDGKSPDRGWIHAARRQQIAARLGDERVRDHFDQSNIARQTARAIYAETSEFRPHYSGIPELTESGVVTEIPPYAPTQQWATSSPVTSQQIKLDKKVVDHLKSGGAVKIQLNRPLNGVLQGMPDSIVNKIVIPRK